MNSENFPRLYQFLGAYFHEDWMCESEFADDIVKSFLVDSSVETVLSVEAEINELLMLSINEPELRVFLLVEMSCCYCYWDEWSSGRAWLAHVLVLLGDEL